MNVNHTRSSPLHPPLKLAVLISGGGTTLTNFLDKKAAGELDIEVPLVIASRPDCGGVAKAKAAGLRCEVVRRRDFQDIGEFSTTIFGLCREVGADLVTLAGYLSLIHIPEDYQHRVMNIHPALIPAFCGHGFYGHKVHEAVVARGVKVSGCTVHFADNEYDHGPIIGQKTVPVSGTDTPDQVAANVFQAECELYPEMIRLFAAGKIKVVERRTIIQD
ncbi:phosphoribosylglycinamide formyltransferase [Gimesia sp.]|uniref:phosphoribosylglycinamide formyltransferase n=1 Tax=Gimesia sp. TaxID=2024833 RepID=UPI000C604756|nr:phosphoribosylglycinamide formyltransferase [Gimesia sp.]MAX35118.1 phosphoribosylglycinamide formyltransferase [Gimesia sp.]HAH48025.1 phosphoribosylglycinamide formyltransferase [Planctomycetaceae bacterium]